MAKVKTQKNNPTAENATAPGGTLTVAPEDQGANGIGEPLAERPFNAPDDPGAGGIGEPVAEHPPSAPDEMGGDGRNKEQLDDMSPDQANDPATDEAPVVEVVPVRCPHCRRINCSTVKSTYTIPGIVYQVAKMRYRGVRWQYRLCTACYKRFSSRSPLEMIE